jgi:predicted small secreted protein
MIKRLVSALLAVVLFAALSGCHTLQGMGKDIEEGGEAIQDAAD